MLEKEGASENAKRKAGDKILFLSLAASPQFQFAFLFITSCIIIGCHVRVFKYCLKLLEFKCITHDYSYSMLRVTS